QCGPKYLINISQQTICRKLIQFKEKYTILVSHHLFLIKKLLYLRVYILNYILLLVMKTGACISANSVVFNFGPCQMMVTNIFLNYNPQITKARIIFLYKSDITLNRRLSMLVGISEAIRLLFIPFNLFYFYLYSCFKDALAKLSIFLVSFLLLSVGFERFCELLKFWQAGWGNRPAPRRLTLDLKFVLAPLRAHRLLFLNLKNLFNYKEMLLVIKFITNKFRLLFLNPKVNIISSVTSNCNTNLSREEKVFNQWLAGLIDGDGCFQLSKKGYASLEIVMQTRDKNCLYQIKQKFGGSVKLRSGVNYLRYRMHHKKGMLDLINAVNGEIRNPIRLLQLNKICDKYNIQLIQPLTLTYENGWFSGFFDSDGSVYLNIAAAQVYITAGQKNKYLLDLICNLYGGTVYIEKISFKWIAYKKSEILKLLDYFKMCPSRSAKNNRLKSIKRYHELRELKAHLASDLTILGKAWKKFLLRWEKWEK
uniref:LAGLIDADG endonuclease n=1 Tax=Ramaria rubella TaxID=113071 RepID=UPI002237C501